jgi:cytoskeleton protein RodZ
MKDNNKSDNQEQALDQSLLPNEYLADARKKKGIDERHAADALKISVARLRSIENGDYSVFPSATYVRGHLRKYSRFLDVDEERMVKAYNSANPPSFDFVNPENNSKEKKASGDSSSKRSRKFLLLTVMFVVLWIAAYSFFGQPSTGFSVLSSLSSSGQSSSKLGDTQSKSAESISDLEIDETAFALKDEVLASKSVLVSASRIIEPDELEINELAENISEDGDIERSGSSEVISVTNFDVSTISSEQNQSVLPLGYLLTEPNIVVSKVTAAELVRSIASADVSASPVLLEPDAHTLTFSFANPCWVKVTDVGGTVIFAGLKSSDSTLRVSGDAPFKIVLGNVDGTSLAYNDAPVILEQQVGGRPLRLVVGQ